MVPLVIITTLDVLGRSFFTKPFPGAVEISEYILSMIVLLAAGYTQQVKGHVWVDLIVRRLSRKTKRVIDVVTTVFCAFIVSVLTYEGLIHAIKERTVSDMLRIPQKPFRLLVFVSGMLLLLEFIGTLLDLAKKKEEA
ncbi:MAG: TRAP transporter small permease [Deltaproteobacteria bacterium]|nr:TRAP transporter small permease [Deltaproteobacteria bacterium]